MDGIYLNTSSTNAKLTGTLNPSDLAYPENLDLREEYTKFQTKICDLIDAPIGAQVIINSGATESIANCVFWCKKYNPYGIIIGSDFDHSSVEDNAKNFDMPYEKTLGDAQVLNDKVSMIMLTHVNSRTGEILDIENICDNIQQYKYLYENNVHSDDKKILQFRPIIAVDATQSIMKVPISMRKLNANAIFFSLHKLGGPMGFGVLVVAPAEKMPYYPLISGMQQNGLRGGTFPLKELLYSNWRKMFENYDDYNKRKDIWEKYKNKIEKAGLKLYTPKGKHLYNTYLIDINGNCPLGIINDLAKKGIYVGNSSACLNEKIYDNQQKLSGGNTEERSAIRISFLDKSDINDKVVDEIIKEIMPFTALE